MRIVDREEFLALPSNTLYAKLGNEISNIYELDVSEVNLSIKYQTDGNSWVYSDLIDFFRFDSNERCEIMEKLEDGQSVDVDCEFTSRDAFFETKGKFLVFSSEDCQKIVAAIQACAATNLSTDAAD